MFSHPLTVRQVGRLRIDTRYGDSMVAQKELRS